MLREGGAGGNLVGQLDHGSVCFALRWRRVPRSCYSDPCYSVRCVEKHSAAREDPMYKIVRSSRLYEQIVQQVEESIHKGALKPGDQLPPERELAEQFGVSRTAVREAVRHCGRKVS